jgi:hypothetical protein
MKRRMRSATRVCCLPALATGIALSIGGCHTPLIDTTIVNQGPVLHVLELDYPSASFGVDVLVPGGQYHYRFNVHGSGPLTLHFEDSSGKDHTASGPTLSQGQEGFLTVTVDAANHVSWNTRLK